MVPANTEAITQSCPKHKHRLTFTKQLKLRSHWPTRISTPTLTRVTMVLLPFKSLLAEFGIVIGQ